MITYEQALTEDHFHWGQCHRSIGPRGGVTVKSEHWRRNGATQTWKRDPEAFRVPLKYGMREYTQMYEHNAHEFHVPADCPLNDENWEG